MPKIVMILSNPDNEVKLRMDRELKLINSVISTAVAHDFQCVPVPAITIAEFPALIIRESPTVLHFSGHGNKSTLSFEDKFGDSDKITGEALKDIFEETGQYIDCMVINACDSASTAGMLKNYIPYIIAFPGRIEDELAVSFSGTFYETLSLGHTVKSAFKMARATIISKIGEKKRLPVILVNEKLPHYRERLFAIPAFTVSFEIGKTGKPITSNGMYSLEFNVTNFPSNASYIIYEFIDETIPEKSRFYLVKDLHSGSSCDDYLFGNIIIRIWIWIEAKGYGIGFQSTIKQGLDNYYKGAVPPACRAAYKEIISN